MDAQSSDDSSPSAKPQSGDNDRGAQESRRSPQPNEMGSPRKKSSSKAWWFGPLAVLVVFLIGLGIWLIPKRTNEVVSVDGQHRWSDEQSPPRRDIVWQPAEPAEPLGAEAGAKESLIRPQLADDGTSLYFTLRSEDRSKDIFRSRLVAGEWQQAVAVDELNTAADDIGPVIQADGQVLYLYSNREGGSGGFDLYVSQRTDDGWSEPKNLGPNINSPAHEYDPAITSTGSRLYFSSNRSPRMHRLIKEGKLSERSDHWKTTLRADLGLNKFDLYVASRDESDNAWNTASPLTNLNRTESNEGAPYIAPNDAFIYFVSDRGQRESEETNFDIFRARIRDGEVAQAENLGVGVNTPRNELEPALSPEGFRIFFSRNLENEDTGEQYALFSSTAIEIEDEASWDSSNWEAFLAMLSNINWWWVLLCLLIAALIAALIWFIRQVSLRRATVPVFLLAALILHSLLGAGTYFVTFGGGIFEDIREKVKEIVSTKIESEDEEPEKQLVQKDYEQMATLESVNRVQPTEITKQKADALNVPVPTDSAVPKVAIRMSQPRELDRQQPDSPQAQPRTLTNPELQRQRPIEPVAQAQIELDQPEAQQQQTSSTARPQIDLTIDQQTPAPKIANAPPIRRPIEAAIEIAQEKIENERAEDQPNEAPTAKPQPLERQQVALVDTPEPLKVNPLKIDPVQAAAKFETTKSDVNVDRTTPAPDPATAPVAPPRRIQVDSAQPIVTDEAIERIDPTQPNQPATTNQPTAIERAVAIVSQPAAVGEVKTLKLSAPVLKSTPTAPESVEVGIAKKTQSVPQIAAGQLPRSATPANADIKLAAAELPIIEITTDDNLESTTNLARVLEDKREAAAAQADSEPVEIAALTAPPLPGQPSRLAPRRGSVAVDRSAVAGPTGKAAPLKFAAPRRSVSVAVDADLIEPLTGNTAIGGVSSSNVKSPLDRTSRNDTTGSPVSESIETVKNATPGAATKELTASTVGVNLDRQAENTNATSGIALRLSPSSAKIGAPTAPGTAQVDRAASAQPGTSQRSPIANRLEKSSLVVGGAVFEAITADSAPGIEGDGNANQPNITGVSVGVDRDDAISINLKVDSARTGGPHQAGDPRLALGELSRQRVDTQVAINLAGTGKSLRPARAKRIPFFAEDNIGLQASLRLRQIDDSAKKELIRAFSGGNPDETLQAIRRGLLWLSTQQHEDGRWRLNVLLPVNGQMPSGKGGQNCDAAATGFALLPFLGDNNTHKSGTYKDHVAKGLKWLVDHQQGSGELTQGNEGNARMYGHGIASIALCEAYALTRDQALRGPAQKAIDFIVAAQDKNKGGWRYHPGTDSDTSVVGWQVMALKSAQMADLNVPQETLDGARKWLNHVAGKGDKLGRFGYTNPGDVKNAMTAEALLCLAYLGTPREDSRMQLGAQHLAKHLPQQGKDNSYYWYYGTQVMYHMQDDYWKQWDNAFAPMLLKTQHKEGHMAGTWDPKDNWENAGGRIFSTSLRILMLEVYWRHLPLYKVIKE
jgi:hypothetical protein